MDEHAFLVWIKSFLAWEQTEIGTPLQAFVDPVVFRNVIHTWPEWACSREALFELLC